MPFQSDESPWQRGRRDYREGKRLEDNPFAQEPERGKWEQGWRLQRCNAPHAGDEPERDGGMELLSPWAEDDSGYGGHY